ncbi:hypothetical protein [Sinorhizobium fredii]|uniref:hypothetical protein n=1 Tax=Rhizobium fredii TaxID=380 RepID=UPI00351905C2
MHQLMSEIKDTIPRLQQILPHMREQLVALREGATFEAARQRYSATVERLALQGNGRRTASRVGDRDAYWSSTADMLMEAMRLGFIEKQQVPSARRYVEAHRSRAYALTELGLEVAELAQTDIAAFCDRLGAALYEAHPYFQALTERLQLAPIACPEVSEGEVEETSRAGRGTQYWAEYVAQKLGQQNLADLRIDPDAIRRSIVAIVRQRFGTAPETKPAGKALTQALNDAFAVAAFEAHGLPIGATEIDILKSWGSQLRILDQSRYVPDFGGFNLIWLAANIEQGTPVVIKRRELRQHEREIAKAVVEAYRWQAGAADTSLSAPYLPIFKVRADAAFRCRVTRALVDLVIERLSGGAIKDVPDRVLLHLGTTRQPASEPVYRRGGNRRYELTIHPTSN